MSSSTHTRGEINHETHHLKTRGCQDAFEREGPENFRERSASLGRGETSGGEKTVTELYWRGERIKTYSAGIISQLVSSRANATSLGGQQAILEKLVGGRIRKRKKPARGKA